MTVNRKFPSGNPDNPVNPVRGPTHTASLCQFPPEETEPLMAQMLARETQMYTDHLHKSVHIRVGQCPHLCYLWSTNPPLHHRPPPFNLVA